MLRKLRTVYKEVCSCLSAAAGEAAETPEENEASPAEGRRECYRLCRGLATEWDLHLDVPAMMSLDVLIDFLADPANWAPGVVPDYLRFDRETDPRRDLAFWHDDRLVAVVKVNANRDGYNVTRFDTV
jgi:hypothetical protein